MVIWFGLGRATAFWLPMAMLLLMLPLPRFIADPVLSMMQTAAYELGSMVARASGANLHNEGQLLTAGPFEIPLSDAVLSLNEVVAIVLIAMLYVGYSRRPILVRFLPLILVLPTVVIVAGLRVGLIGVVAHHLGTSEAERFLQLFGGPALVGLSALIVIAGAQVASKLLERKTSTPHTEMQTVDHDGRPNLAQLRHGLQQRSLAATALLACSVSAVFLLTPERAGHLDLPGPRAAFVIHFLGAVSGGMDGEAAWAF